jgi:tetratricopeptide (TPR) repeat protein
MTTAKKKPVKKALVRVGKPGPVRKVAPTRPRYSEHYERAIKEYENGMRLLHKRSFAEALAAFRELTKTYAEEQEVCDRARQYIAICEERVREKPRQTSPTADPFHVGVYHLNRAETESALKEFEKALEANPKSDKVHYAIASVYALSGDKARAVAALQAAVRLNERNRVFAQNDPDFDRIRDDHEFIQLVEPEGAGAR